jgi:hypothetical protein
MRSIESDQVVAKYWLARRGNHMDGEDCSFETPERAIIGHTNSATYWQYVLLQDMLTSPDFYRVGSWTGTRTGFFPTSCPSTKTYDCLVH